ncbi:MAG: SCP2 sterol-binding domain-containing protein [Lachnospiraceae bacterium]|nr:SCP2 sterol-binding domain-containing protein [Lachnospiraceae bacterium]
MKVNIYYGGRGMIDDPSLYVVNKIEEVLLELNVKLELFRLSELKNTITTLPASINDCDGIILATTVEWFGMGGFMHQFLDACWLYGNREKFATTYMCPVVVSKTFGERETMSDLISAWEILGGLPCNGIAAYVDDLKEFEADPAYNNLIEKTAENIYRTISQKTPYFPTSNQAIKQIVKKAPAMPLTREETEQLSQYAADESYVQKQKEDIAELTNLFKGMMENSGQDESIRFIPDLEGHFKPHGNVNAVYRFDLKEKKKSLIAEIVDSRLTCYYGENDSSDVKCRMDTKAMEQIISGRITLQKAFMTGMIQAKGDIKTLRLFDQIFDFSGEEG